MMVSCGSGRRLLLSLSSSPRGSAGGRSNRWHKASGGVSTAISKSPLVASEARGLDAGHRGEGASTWCCTFAHLEPQRGPPCIRLPDGEHEQQGGGEDAAEERREGGLPDVGRPARGCSPPFAVKPAGAVTQRLDRSIVIA
jgi:hypothetical protein